MAPLALLPPANLPAVVAAEPLAIAETVDVRCAAHDLKNKLQVAMGFCELLPQALRRYDEASRTKALHYVAHIRTATEQSVLIADRIGRAPVALVAAVDLNALLIEEVGPLCHGFLREGINMIVEPGMRVPAALVDPVGLARTVMNLAANARDAILGQAHRVTSGRITFSTSVPALATPRPYTTLSVCDNGPGIPGDVLAQIWQPGYSTKEPAGGAGGRRGLGLASVRAFLEASGGTVDVLTELGKGTTFVLSLPAAT